MSKAEQRRTLILRRALLFGRRENVAPTSGCGVGLVRASRGLAGCEHGRAGGQHNPARRRGAALRVIRDGLARTSIGLVSTSSDPLANSALEPTDTPRYALDLGGRGAPAAQREALARH